MTDMSITSDIRGYADTALDQGKQYVGQAQAQFQDLRAQAEKTLNVDAVKTAVEPYLAQAKQYRANVKATVNATVTDRAEGLVATVKGNDRVAKVLTTAETVTGAVVGTVQERVVKPVVSLTGRGSGTSAAKKATPRPAKTATTRPAKPAATTAPAKKAPAKKAPAKKASTARTAASKKTSS
jgi:hypothetical protein